MKERNESETDPQNPAEGLPLMGSRRRFIKTSAGAMLAFGVGLSIPEADAASAGLTGTGTGDFKIVSVDFTWGTASYSGGNTVRTVTITVVYENSSGVTRLFEWGFGSNNKTPKMQLPPVAGAPGTQAPVTDTWIVSLPAGTEVDFWGSGSGFDANLDDVSW